MLNLRRMGLEQGLVKVVPLEVRHRCCNLIGIGKLFVVKFVVARQVIDMSSKHFLFKIELEHELFELCLNLVRIHSLLLYEVLT